MTAITIVLPAMYSRSEKICGGREAGGGVALELWQQARAGLLATVVGRKTFPATVRVLSYRQVFDADDHLLQQRSRVTVGREQRAFGAAASARDFARMGFVVDANGLRTYYAPEATYCWIRGSRRRTASRWWSTRSTTPMTSDWPSTRRRMPRRTSWTWRARSGYGAATLSCAACSSTTWASRPRPPRRTPAAPSLSRRCRTASWC